MGGAGGEVQGWLGTQTSKKCFTMPFLDFEFIKMCYISDNCVKYYSDSKICK